VSQFQWGRINNLLQFGFTNVCPLGTILKKLGVPEVAPCAPVQQPAGPR
jgi:hypothetical protein